MIFRRWVIYNRMFNRYGKRFFTLWGAKRFYLKGRLLPGVELHYISKHVMQGTTFEALMKND